MIDVVARVAKEVFIPLCVGGGLRSVEDMRAVLGAGADKVAVTSYALKDPEVLSRAARAFGSQCVVLSIDAKRAGGTDAEPVWHAFINGGRVDTGVDVLEWAARGEELGAGEILLNSMDRDGTKAGFDLELTRRVSERAGIPVIASGGAGTMDSIVDAVRLGKADAVLVASLLHFGEATVGSIKRHMEDKGVSVRW